MIQVIGVLEFLILKSEGKVEFEFITMFENLQKNSLLLLLQVYFAEQVPSAGARFSDAADTVT